MGRLAVVGCAFLLVFAGTASAAQDTDALQREYSHIQDLNNAGYALADKGSATPDRLREAIDKLKQAQAAIDQMQAALSARSWYARQVFYRSRDNLLIQADAYVQLGEPQAALDALEGLTRGGIDFASKERLLKDKRLDSLHDDPRFKALLAKFDAVARRWNATAFTQPGSKLTEAQRIAGLSLFWSEVRYNFVHFDLVPDLDWNQAYLDFLPRVIAAKNLHDYYDVLMRFAPLLHDGHTNIYPPKSIADQFLAAPPILTALVENKVIVTWVGDPRIAKDGVHVGDEIVSIDGEEVHKYAREHVEPYVSSPTPQDRAVRMYTYQLLDGDHRKPVVLGIRDAAGRQRSVTLSREPDPHAKGPPAFAFRMLPGGIAYLKLGEFENDEGDKLFAKHLPQILAAKGLILDVRDNGGGSSRYAADILTWLSGKPIPVPPTRSRKYIPTYRAWSGPQGHWISLTAPGETYSNPRKQHFSGPVAVLIGPRTFSAAEDFVVGFEAMKRGILVGRRTAGSTGEPLGFKLPGGGFARVCTLDETFPDGRTFVGIGIPPDITVAPTVADIRAGRDRAIDAAAKALLAKKPVAAPGG